MGRSVEQDEAFLSIVPGRRGHFQLESGHHSGLWLDLDTLFAEPARINPIVAELSAKIGPYSVDAVCGPLVGGAFLAQAMAQVLGCEFWFSERQMPPRDPEGALFQARYELPHSFIARAQARRVAIVDDVMSAGSALRGTYTNLRTHGATIVVAGALLVLGETGATFFANENIPVESTTRLAYALWVPSECPLCAQGVALETVT